MAIRFKCPHCQKPLSVKDHLAGKKAACPVCKKGLTIPAQQPASTAPAGAPGGSPPGGAAPKANKPAPVAPPADMEDFAAAAFSDEPPPPAADPNQVVKTIDFTCPFCDEELHLPADQGGKQAPCPECKRIIKIPLPKEDKPKDWRELIKKGPSAALVNQPDQLEGAWGTEAKTKVSGTAMEEAGALPEVQVEPVGVGGWIKRLFQIGLVVGVIALSWWGVKRATYIKEEKNALAMALALVSNKDDKLPPVLVGEVHRGVGLVHIRKGEAAKARERFSDAQTCFLNDKTTSSFEKDLFLIELALSQIELGGSEDDAISKTRLRWKVGDGYTVQTILGRTFNQMAPEAKALALREVANMLIEAGQADLAISLAADLAGGARSPLQAQQVALMVARDKTDDAEKILPAPVLGKGALDPLARQAHAEGQARKGDFDGALELAKVASPPLQRLETNLGVASIALAAGKAEKAKPFVDNSLAIVKNELKGKTPPLLLLQTMKQSSGSESPAGLKELLAFLPTEVKGWGKLAVVEAQLRQGKGAVDEKALLDDFTDKEAIPRALAHAVLGRHNAKMGEGGAVRQEALAASDNNNKAMLWIGYAVGEQERRR